MEGKLGALRKSHEALSAALKQEQENHEKTHATILAMTDSHAIALSEAEEVYKRFARYKEDVMSYKRHGGSYRIP